MGSLLWEASRIINGELLTPFGCPLVPLVVVLTRILSDLLEKLSSWILPWWAPRFRLVTAGFGRLGTRMCGIGCSSKKCGVAYLPLLGLTSLNWMGIGELTLLLEHGSDSGNGYGAFACSIEMRSAYGEFWTMVTFIIGGPTFGEYTLGPALATLIKWNPSIVFFMVAEILEGDRRPLRCCWLVCPLPRFLTMIYFGASSMRESPMQDESIYLSLL